MQEVAFAGKKIRFQMSPMASVIYSDEFNGADLCEEYSTWSQGAKDGKINLTLNLKVLWASAKAVDPSLPSFRLWMRGLPQSAMDVIANLDVFTAIATEYKDAFFPEHGEGEGTSGKQTKSKQ